MKIIFIKKKKIIFSLILIFILFLLTFPQTKSQSSFIKFKTDYQIEEEQIPAEETKLEDFGSITINKINLSLNFYPLKDHRNNIDQNIELLHLDLFKKNIVLVGHSGKGKLAYFNNLDKLAKKDLVSIKILDNKLLYKYSFTEKIIKSKINNLKLSKVSGNLILITCDKLEKNKFYVIHLNLQKEV